MASVQVIITKIIYHNLHVIIVNLLEDSIAEPTFLLASPSTINKQNLFLAQSGSVIRWDHIEHPPVILPLTEQSSESGVSYSAPSPVEATSTAAKEMQSQATNSTSPVSSGLNLRHEDSQSSNIHSAGSRGLATDSAAASRHSRVDSFDDDISDAASQQSRNGLTPSENIHKDSGNEMNNVGVVSSSFTDDGSHTIDLDNVSQGSETLNPLTRKELQLLIGKDKVVGLGPTWDQKHLTLAKGWLY